MLLLLFFVFLIQFFTYWIFEPLSSFLEYFLEIKFKKNEKNDKDIKN